MAETCDRQFQMSSVARQSGSLAASSAAGKVKYDNHKVFRVIPTSNEHLELLKQLQDNEEGYSYWIAPAQVLNAAELMVSPSKLAEFEKSMVAAGMTHETYIDDVQRLIDEENPARDSSSNFDWTHYHPLERIYKWLHDISAAHPDKIEVVDAGRSYEGRVIKGVKLSFGANKPGVFIEGGIHAREWISPATVAYLVDALLTSDDPAVRRLAEACDWYFFPVFNPDGYVYTHTTDRLWRKTRSATNNGTCCRGVDANRNWGYKWMHGGASDNPCAETYAGSSRAFSEIETKTMSEYISSISDKLFAYISFHSYSQVLMFPYGYTGEHLDNYKESKSIARKAVEALSERHGTKYQFGTIYETMYLSSGASIEWVKGELELPLTFEYELRDRGKYGFLLPARQIVPNSREVLDSLIGMFAEAKEMGYPSPRKVTQL